MAEILVIDDDPRMRRAAQRILQAAGYGVRTYENGTGAIADLAAEPADLLITDIFMPDMEGLETIRRARELRPAMPIMAITGLSFDERDYLEIALRFGAAATLKKPFRPAELLETVARLLAARPA